MFVSFFPRPRVFFISVLIWTALSMALWYGYAKDLFGASEPDIIGVGAFWATKALWFDIYFAACVAMFAGAWMMIEPHPWALWSILGSALILFTTYFQVQVSVTINGWFGPFYDLIQASAIEARSSYDPGIQRLPRDVSEHRARRGRGRRARAVFHLALHFSLAHGDERLLRRELAAASQDRGRVAAYAGRHDAVCDHHGEPRRQLHRRGPDTDRVPAGAGQAVEQHNGAADRWRDSLSAGVCGGDLVARAEPASWR